MTFFSDFRGWRSRVAVSSGGSARALLGLVILVASTQRASAQTVEGALGAGAFQIGSPGLFGQISLGQNLGLEVPVRLGLYLNRNSSSFPENAQTNCYLAATRNAQSGDVTRLDLPSALTAALYDGDGQVQAGNVYSYPGEFRWQNPALELAAPTRTLPLLCLSRTVISAFVNKAMGWRLTALYQAAPYQGASQPLLVALRFPNSRSSSVSFQPAAADYLSSGITHGLLRSSGAVTTGGWQDGFFLLGMLFEGGLPTPSSVGQSVNSITLAGQSLEFQPPSQPSSSLSLSIADLDQP